MQVKQFSLLDELNLDLSDKTTLEYLKEKSIFDTKNIKKLNNFLEYEANISKLSDDIFLDKNFNFECLNQFDGHFYLINFNFINEYTTYFKPKDIFEYFAFWTFKKYSNNFEYDKKLSNFVYIIENFDSLKKLYLSSKNMINDFENNISSIENYSNNIAQGLKYCNNIFENIAQTNNILSSQTKQKIFSQIKFFIGDIISQWKVLLEYFIQQIDKILNIESNNPNILALKIRIQEMKKGLEFSSQKLNQLQEIYK